MTQINSYLIILFSVELYIRFDTRYWRNIPPGQNYLPYKRSSILKKVFTCSALWIKGCCADLQTVHNLQCMNLTMGQVS